MQNPGPGPSAATSLNAPISLIARALSRSAPLTRDEFVAAPADA